MVTTFTLLYLVIFILDQIQGSPLLITYHEDGTVLLFVFLMTECKRRVTFISVRSNLISQEFKSSDGRPVRRVNPNKNYNLKENTSHTNIT